MRRLFIAVLAAFAAAPLTAATGQTGGFALTQARGARSAAMSDALTADYGTIDSIYVNPASVARVASPVLTASYRSGMLDQNFGLIGYAQSVGPVGFHAGVSYFDAGTIDLNLSNGVTGSRRAQQDTVGLLGIAFGREGALSIGATAKAYRFELAEEASASGMAVDAGVLVQTGWEALAVGASALNMGDDVTFESVGDPLPTSYRGGLRLLLTQSMSSWLRAAEVQVLVTADAIKLKDDDSGAAAGLEILHPFGAFENPGHAAFRAGYDSTLEAYSGGLGVRLGRFVFDYGVGFGETVDTAHRASFSVLFGGEKTPAPRRRTL